MQLGMIGLGRMGANMVRRLVAGDHECVVFDRSEPAVKELVGPKVVGAASLADLAQGTFQRVLGDAAAARRPAEVRRILLCTGKLYWELLERAEKRGRGDVAIVRVEQLYPLPEAELREALAPYPAGLEVRWVQEEPRNMGAWPFLRLHGCEELTGRPLHGVYRAESASPATGSLGSHKLEQEELLAAAFEGLDAKP